MSSHPDVIVIGAGAAGLAAAHRLSRQRLGVLLLEARDRLGGRCWTRYEPGIDVPIEYGAEFLHGRPAATLGFMRRYAIEAIERAGTRWYVDGGEARLRERTPFLSEIRTAMRAAGVPRRDVDFAAYLEKRLGGRISAETRLLAQRMVEGYDAADPTQVSARAIVEEWTSGADGADRNFRPRGGYGALLGAMAEEVGRRGVELRFQRVVRAVHWSRGRVEVEGDFLGQPFRVRAARAIISLPLGVLQAERSAPGAVGFFPPLESKRAALAGLASGPALKVVMTFRAPFWTRIARGRYRNAGFFQSPHADFPTIWTALPASAPVLVAWAGGPRALRMSGAPAATLIEAALSSVASVFAQVDVRGSCVAAYVHDWPLDPYARGAYAYTRVGGGNARRALAAPLRGTLYFAGEATDYQGETGTVAGALQSGERAAREVLAELR